MPEIRFEGFTEPWEQRKLGDVCEIKDSARIPNSEWTESGVPYIRASDVTNENIDGALFPGIPGCTERIFYRHSAPESLF